jgi:hypothetical protein
MTTPAINDFVVRAGLVVQGDNAATTSSGTTGTLQVAGGASFSKNIVVGSTASISGPLLLGGDLIVQNRVFVYGTATFVGNISLNTITIGSSVVETIEVTNSATVRGPFNAFGTSTFHNSVYIVGTSTLYVEQGQTNLAGLSVRNQLVVLDTTHADLAGNASLVAYGGVFVEDNLIVAANNSNLVTLSDNSIYSQGGLGVVKDGRFGGSVIIGGSLTVLGTQTIINSTSTSIVDPIIDIGTGANNSQLPDNDGLNKGIVIHYFDLASNHMFVGRNSYNGRFIVKSNVAPNVKFPNNSDYVNSGVYAGADFGSLILHSGEQAINSSSGALQVIGGIGVTDNIYTENSISGGSLRARNLANYRLVFSNNSELADDASLSFDSVNKEIVGRIRYANSSTNISGGAIGSMPYQTDVGLTDFISIGANGYVLQSNGVTPYFGPISGLSAGSSQVSQNLGGGFAGAIPFQNATSSTVFNGNLSFDAATGILTSLGALFTATTVATNTQSGALQVRGGVGIGGALYVNQQSYVAGAEIVTSATIYKFADITTVTAGTDTAVNTSTGNITIWNTSTLQSITNRGAETSNPITLTNENNSTGNSDGALIVAGGVSIAKTLYVGGYAFSNGSEVITTSSIYRYADITTITAGTDTAVNTATGNITIWNTSTLQSITSRGSQTNNAIAIRNATSATSTTTGALTVAGGVGIGGDLYVARNAYIGNNAILTSGTVNDFIPQTVIVAGTDTAVNTNTGIITVWNISTLDSVLSRGSSSNRAVTLNNTLTVRSIIANGVNLLNYDTDVWYVSDIGDDLNDGRRIQSAFKTIRKALSVAQVGHTVFIEAGSYQETFPLTIPQGVSVKGSGLRTTLVSPTTATNTQTAFLLNGETTISDFTVSGFRKPGYAFKFAPGAKITTRSPYVERFSVITRGSTTSTSDPYGFAAGDAGGGAYLDASVLDPTSLEPSMLWNEATFIVPNAIGMYMTNGARAELLNGFTYFADKSIVAEAGTLGLGGVGKVRLRLQNVTGTFTPGDTIVYKNTLGVTLASGTIDSVNSDYVYINGPVWGFDTVFDRTAKSAYIVNSPSSIHGATLSSTQAKFGSASFHLQETTSRLEILNDTDFAFGSTKDYTFEGWIWPDVAGYGNKQYIFYKGNQSDQSIRLYLNSSNQLVGQHGTTTIVGTSVLSLSTWRHVALVKRLDILEIYLNGTLEASISGVLDNVTNTDPFNIGGNTTGFIGYVDDVRVSSIARYNGSFSVPTSAQHSDVSTILMLHFDGANGSTSIVDDPIASQTVYSTGSSPASARRIILADYHQFGAELRCIGSAAVFGNQGVIANGTGTDLKLIAFNLSFIGSGGDLTDDATLTIQSNEIIKTNGGKIYYQTVDQSGDFRVGDSFLVNQRTGDVSFGASALNLNNISSISVTDGTNSTVVTPGNIAVGNLNLGGNTFASLTGDIVIDPSGNLTTINSNLDVNGTLNVSQAGFINGFPILTEGSLANVGVTTIIGGTDTAITTNTGIVTIYNTSTLQSVTERGATTDRIITLTTLTNAVSSSSGALHVRGGVGIEKDLYVGNTLFADTVNAINLTVSGSTYIPGGITATNFTTTELTVVGVAALQQIIAAIATVTDLTVSNLVDRGGLVVQGVFTGTTASIYRLSINGNIASTGTTTGALIVAGGAGIGGRLYASELYDNNSRVLTQASFGQFGVSNIVGGTGTSVSTSTGQVVIWSTATLQTVTNYGRTTDKSITVGGLQVTGESVFNGNVTFLGTASYVYTQENYYTENLIVLHATTGTNTNGWTFNDGKDIGIMGDYYDTVGNTSTQFFMGWRNGTPSFEFFASGYLNQYGNFVGTLGDITVRNYYSMSTSQSTSRTSGAIQTLGGIGAQGNIYAAAIYDTERRVLTSVTPVAGFGIDIVSVSNTNSQATFTVNNLGVLSVVAGTDTTVSTATGVVTISNNSTLQTVTSRGATTNQAINITNATSSTNPGSGALIVAGGVGISGTVNISGDIFVDGIIHASVSGSINTATNIARGFAGAIPYQSGYGQTTFSPHLTFNGSALFVSTTTQAFSTGTGALVVEGGVGIGGALWVNTTSFVAGNEIITTATVNAYASKTTITAGTDTAINTSTGNVTIWNTSTLQSITQRGNITTSSIHANGLYDNGDRVVTRVTPSGSTYIGIDTVVSAGTATSFAIRNLGVTQITVGSGLSVTTSTGTVLMTNTGVLSLVAGTDTSVSQSAGNVTIWNTGTLQSITNRGSTTTNAIYASALYDNGNRVVTRVDAIGSTYISIDTVTSTGTATTFTIRNLGVQQITTGSGILVNASTGTVQITSIDTLQLVTARGNTTNYAVTITNATLASSTITGALVVSGGVGIGGALFVNATSYIGGSQIITTATVNDYSSKTVITAGTDTAVSTSTGNVTIWNTSTLQSITNRGSTTTNAINANGLYDNGERVVTRVVPNGTTFIGIDSVFSAGTATSFTIRNLGVTQITTGSGLIVSAATGSVQISSIDTLQLVTARGNATSNAVTITNTTLASSTITGALVVTGGVGIGGALFVSTTSFVFGNEIITTATVNIYASRTVITAGTDTQVTTSTGNVTIWNTSTLQSITNRGATTNNAISFTNGTDASSTTTGAVIVTGGVGIGGALFVNTTSFVYGNEILTSATVNTYASKTIITAGTDTQVTTSTGNVTIWNTSTLQSITNRGSTTTNIVYLVNSTNATNTQSGALQITGGAGIGGDVYIGGSLNAITKSFLINHPTKPGMKLRYGSLEGPENGVYVRGKLEGNNVIELPEYWVNLVDFNTITVNLTPIGRGQQLFVEEIKDNKVYVGNDKLFNNKINCYYTVYAERKDVDKLDIEI